MRRDGTVMAKTMGDIDSSIASMTPKAIARQAALRIQREQKRQAARAKEVAALYEVTQRNHRTKRSWRAAVLARIMAGETD